ncbi:15613_t:CDS:2, partial [Rhizophagus irregularis]
SHSGKGKFSLPTLRRYSSTTNLHQQENVNTPQILQRNFKDDENYGYINPTLTTYETHLHTPTHNYSFYYPCRSKSVPLLPKLSEEYSQLSQISESWPFARYPLRSTFYNLSDLPPSNPSPRSFNNSKISVTPPLKHSQSKSSTRSSRSKSVSRSLSKSSLRSKSLSRTHSKGSLRRSKSELFPPTIKKSYDPNHSKILEDWKNNISQIEEFNIAEQFRLNQSNSIDIEKSVNYKSKALPKFYEILPTSSNE